MLVAPILSPATIARTIFSRSSSVGSRLIDSRIKPLLEVHFQARKHFFFNVFDVGELAPTSDIAVFAIALKLHNEFLHQPQLVPVFFPEMLFCKYPPFVSAGFWCLIPYCAQDRNWNVSLQPHSRIEARAAYTLMFLPDPIAHVETCYDCFAAATRDNGF